MGKYEDFDLDMKVTSEAGSESKGTTVTVTTFSVVVCVSNSCMICISKEGCTNDCTGWCSNDCPTPTKDHPAASCHFKNENGVQRRC